MKRRTLKQLLLGLSISMLGIPIQGYAQNVVLPEVKVSAVNYKYLSSVGDEEVAAPVKRLQNEVAKFDLKNSEYYEDDLSSYMVSFYIPEGTILAAYDKDGKLIRTIEKFKDVALPTSVTKAIATKYPDWKIAKDVYRISFHDRNGVTKRYKILLENGNKRQKVKTNEKGEFI